MSKFYIALISTTGIIFGYFAICYGNIIIFLVGQILFIGSNEYAIIVTIYD